MEALYLTGHSLGGAMASMLAVMLQTGPEFGVLADAADTLNPYAVEVRYADDWRDIPPEEAGTAVGLAEKFTDFILPRLGLSPEEQRPWQKA
jgi:hypothetical protein